MLKSKEYKKNHERLDQEKKKIHNVLNVLIDNLNMLLEDGKLKYYAREGNRSQQKRNNMGLIS